MVGCSCCQLQTSGGTANAKLVVEEDVYLTKNNFILHTKDRNGALRCQWRKSTFAPDQFSRFLATSNAFSEKYFQSIFVDGVRCSTEKKGAIIGLLRDHIFGQLIGRLR